VDATGPKGISQVTGLINVSALISQGVYVATAWQGEKVSWGGKGTNQSIYCFEPVTFSLSNSSRAVGGI